MYMKLRIPTGAGKEPLLMYLQHYLRIGVICAPTLRKQYEEFAERLRREYQITMRVYDRTDYYHEVLTDLISNGEEKFDAMLIDDYPDALSREYGSHPKVPMFVHMQEFFFVRNIVLIVLE